MRKLCFLYVIVIGVALGCDAAAQNPDATVKLRLRVDDIESILRMVKQDMVYDAVNVAAKEEAVKSCERVLKRVNAKSGMIDVPEKYVLRWVDNRYYNFEEYKRVQNEYKQLMRVMEQLYEVDENLSILKQKDNRNVMLGELRRRALRDLKDKDSKEFNTDEKVYGYGELDDNGEVIKKK